MLSSTQKITGEILIVNIKQRIRNSSLGRKHVSIKLMPESGKDDFDHTDENQTRSKLFNSCTTGFIIECFRRIKLMNSIACVSCSFILYILLISFLDIVICLYNVLLSQYTCEACGLELQKKRTFPDPQGN